MSNPQYAAFTALDPFFDVVMRGMADDVDGNHYFEAIADDAIFEFRYVFPNFPTQTVGRDALMALYSSYGDGTVLHSGDGLVVHRSQEPGVLILEYEVHGKKLHTGKAYDNRFVSVVTIKDRKVVHWRDYMDSLAAYAAETDAAL
ncbi:nuclear transport factor 2 family protein [Xanthobacter aminoxidans]|uniref:nuclear transport factor 2 family protein n=1 Tax=Xanthobacter aminoxidans TaxID=186280 RepID=UPI00372A8E6B